LAKKPKTLLNHLPESEKDLEKIVLSYLEKEPRVSVGIKTDNDKIRARKTAGKKKMGTPDIFGQFINGKAFWIELKFGKGTPTPEQAAFLNQREVDGALAFAAWSLIEVVMIFRQYFRDSNL